MSSDPSVIAIITPDSKSATYSVNLQENELLVSLINTNESLPSPSNSSSENESTDNESYPIVSKSKALSTKRRRSQTAIVLRQSREKEKFTLGSSPNSDVVLKHPESAGEECCYINLVHLQLYPDPECDSLSVYNQSSSLFAIRRLDTPSLLNNLPSGQGARLDCGKWRLQLGEGLIFQIDVLRRSIRDLRNGWSLISSQAIASPFQPARGAKAPRLWGQQNSVTFARTDGAYKDPGNLVIDTSGHGVPAFQGYKEEVFERSLSRAVVKQACNSEKAAIKEAADDLKPPSSLHEEAVEEAVEGAAEEAVEIAVEEAVAVSNIICGTDHTLVYKATRNERLIAIKQFRNPDIPKAAKSWRQELSILCSLHHPCVVTLLDFDASDLRLELEYVGPDLTKYIDKKGKSQLSEIVQYQIWKDISNAIEYVHTQDIVHLDIKPSNILLRENRAVLCDFEISRKEDSKEPVSNGGTPCYIPPEYLFSKKRGYPGDIWAFGVTMLFVFGHLPLPNKKWIIANLFTKAADRDKMIDWLRLIETKTIRKTNLPSALRLMLVEDPTKRITALQLVAALSDLHIELKLVRQ